MRLFIDDERNPADYVNYWQASTEWDHHSKTCEDAIKFLTWWFNGDHDYPVDITIYFDHDLGYNETLHNNETVMPVVDWLAEAKFDGIVNPYFVTCIIHTQNPVGRANIKRALHRWGFETLDMHL